MLLDSDQQTICSFDSSQYIPPISRTESLVSNLQIQKFDRIILTPQSLNKRSIKQQLDRTQSIQKNRFLEEKTQKIFIQQFQQPLFELGFVNGKNKKNIEIGKSKLKKVKNLFNDQSQNQHYYNPNNNIKLFNDRPFFDIDDIFPNQSLMNFPKNNYFKIQNNPIQQITQFSIPCFKNMGKKNKIIDIDLNLLQKARSFFSDQTQSLVTKSFNKPTKIKKINQQPNSEQHIGNFAKTVNVNKKKKIQVKTKQKQIFDWKKYQISQKKLISNDLYSIQALNQLKDKEIKQSQKKQMKSKIKQQEKHQINTITLIKYNYFRLSYQSLCPDNIYYSLSNERVNFQQSLALLQKMTFSHLTNECKILKCILCNLSINEYQINDQFIYNFFTNKLTLQKIDKDKFFKLYDQICFKLNKYKHFYSNVINKQLNVSNILVQMHKKIKSIESGYPFLGWLQQCIKQSKFYQSFCVQVHKIYLNQKINTYFLLLSDGWTSVWSIITDKNILFPFIKKLKILSKLLIGYWKNYPLTNILQFCPYAKIRQGCIQIYYNASIIIKENYKLGKLKKSIFYRSLNLNKKQGGIIPTVQGTVVRIFSIKTPKKSGQFNTNYNNLNSNTYNHNLNIFYEHFLQIITPQGYTVFIKFVLPSQRSLVQLFRLYFKYHFYFLKIGPKDNNLHFNDQYSKFYQFQKKQKHFYQKQLIQLISKRYVNLMTQFSINQILKIDQFYDLKMENNQLEMFDGRYKFYIENQNQNQVTNTNLISKNITTLNQQFKLQRIQKQNKSFKYYFRKYKYSSVLRTIPIIYQKLKQYQSK